MSSYSKADRRAQWFGDKYGSASFKPNCGVLHTTETSTWPGYGGGAMAPNYTGRPNFSRKTIDWRAHYEDEESSRALVNLSGGVETNRANAIQVELIGTCDAQYRISRSAWGKAGVDYLYWPDAPEWAMTALADFLADMNRRHGIPLQGPAMWLSYGRDARAPGRNPASYGKSPARFSFTQWRNFYGWCGHQHVPENEHGDPGSIDASRLFAIARARLGGGTTAPPVKPPVVPTAKPIIAVSHLHANAKNDPGNSDVIQFNREVWKFLTKNDPAYVKANTASWMTESAEVYGWGSACATLAAYKVQQKKYPGSKDWGTLPSHSKDDWATPGPKLLELLGFTVVS